MSKKTAAKTAPKKSSGAKKKPTPSTQKELEAMLREFASMMISQGVSKDDLNALVTSLDAPSAYDHLDDAVADAKNEAQQIAFEAMEATNAAAARKFAKRALRLDPDCVDALVVLNDLDAHTQKDFIEGLQRAVAAGKRSLGDRFFRENKGHFWLLIETRPYMRALETLAGELAGAGLNLDAIAIYKEMLALNPNDNQGVRDPLLGLYLVVGDVVAAGRLLKRYKDGLSACFTWGLVLERLLAGDHKSADGALKNALQSNRHVALHLVGHTPLPNGLPDMYSLGSVEEAMLCQHYLGPAWMANPKALFWVFERCAEMGTSPASTKAAPKKTKMRDAG